jgi:adenylate cyclase class IV
MAHFEIEIKSLLGEKEKADAFREKLLGFSTPARLTGKNSQLNHYFTGGDMRALFETMAPHFSSEQQESLKKILTEGKSHSVRTRQADGKVLLVVKASIGDDTSSNGVSRMEFEQETPGLSLEALDGLLLKSGLEYQAKWSRDREEYSLGDVTVCLDRNAGYGYLAEFEKVVDSVDQAEATKTDLLRLMEELGAAELPQDRLERMFAHYNAHWPEYYGTDKVFVIE